MAAKGFGSGASFSTMGSFGRRREDVWAKLSTRMGLGAPPPLLSLATRLGVGSGCRNSGRQEGASEGKREYVKGELFFVIYFLMIFLNVG